MLRENQVAIVTGAARGIGKGIALELARHGAMIVAVDILGPDSEQTASECGHIAGDALSAQCEHLVARGRFIALIPRSPITRRSSAWLD